MRRQLGICIELNHDRSIFLMKNGHIVRGTPIGNPFIGEETSFYPVEKKKALRWQPILAPIVAAAAAIMLFMSALVFPAEEAFGYVQVQINPGVELGLNDQYKVISIRELNSDGYDLIRQLGDWEGDSLHAVLNQVFDLAVTEDTTQVTVTAVEEDGSKLDQSVKKVVMAVSSDVKNEEFAIQMKEATKKQWRQSVENQVPVGHMIKKVEILKVQKPTELQETETEVPMLPAPIENKARIEQIKQSNSKEKNSNTEIKKNTPATDKKAVPPAMEKKSVPPAAEIKKDDRPLKSEVQQKNKKQNNKIEEPSTKPQQAPPVKEQKKVKPTQSVPKEKPAEKKESDQPEEKERNQPEKKESSQPEKKESSQPEKKESSQPEKKESNQPEKKESNQPEKKKQGNSEAPGQQKKNDAPAASNDSTNKYESRKSPESIQSSGHSKKNGQQSQETKESIPIHENKPGNKQKE